MSPSLDDGTGAVVEKDESKAVEWWSKASDQGYAAAQCDLGWAYDNGRGVPKDSVRAVELYAHPSFPSWYSRCSLKVTAL